MEQRARAEAKRTEWQVLAPPTASTAHVYVAPIAAGEKVVASKRSDIFKFLKDQYGDAVAVEMEGKGFLSATHANLIDCIVVRGISDLVSKKTTSDKKGWQEKASAHAAAFAMQLLSTFDLPRRLVPSSDHFDPTVLRRRDVETLKRILPTFSTSVFDHFLDRSSTGFIPHEIFYYWESFNGELTSGHFHLFDEGLRQVLLAFHSAWEGTLSFGEHFIAIGNGDVYRFSSGGHHDHARHLRARRKFDQQVIGAGKTYATLTEHLKANYPEIDLAQTNNDALDRYNEYYKRLK